MGCTFCAEVLVVDGITAPGDHVFVKRIFNERRRIWGAPKPVRIGLVLGKEHYRLGVKGKLIVPKRVVLDAHCIGGFETQRRLPWSVIWGVSTPSIFRTKSRLNIER